MRKLPSVRLHAVGALLASATLVSASMMLAAPGATAAQGFGPNIFGGPHTNSGNWAGYAAHGAAGTFKTITGDWTEPVAACHGSALAAPWLGLDGYGTETVEQTGAAVSCSGGTAHYKAWYEMYPAAPHYFSNPISAGDSFTASITSEGGGTYKLSISDTTKGWTHSETKTLDSAENASAEAILEGPGGYPGFPDGISFTNITVNGHPLSYYSPTKLTSGGFVPGPLSGGNFTITHK
jgi:hypothetical protein